jgi:hypothetical protein
MFEHAVSLPNLINLAAVNPPAGFGRYSPAFAADEHHCLVFGR